MKRTNWGGIERNQYGEIIGHGTLTCFNCDGVIEASDEKCPKCGTEFDARMRDEHAKQQFYAYMISGVCLLLIIFFMMGGAYWLLGE